MLGVGFFFHAFEDFGVGFHDVAEVAAEAVFVHFFAGFEIPEAAAVGADFVGEDDLGWIFGEAAEFEFEVDEAQVALGEEIAEDFVDFESGFAEEGEVVCGGEFEFADVVVVDEGVAEFIGFDAKFDDGLGELDAFFEAGAFAEAAGGEVADDDFDHEDVDFFDFDVGFVDLADEVGGDAFFFEEGVDEGADGVVEAAFVLELGFFLAVEGGGIVFELHAEYVGVLGGPEAFGFALVEWCHGFRSMDFRGIGQEGSVRNLGLVDFFGERFGLRWVGEVGRFWYEIRDCGEFGIYGAVFL